MKNSIKEQLEKRVEEMSLQDVWKYHIEVRQQISEAELVQKAIVARLRLELGERESLELGDGEGVYWENRNVYSVSISDVENVVSDTDMRNLILKVDFKKAKQILDQETYIALEGKRKIESSTKAFKTGKIKQQ